MGYKEKTSYRSRPNDAYIEVHFVRTDPNLPPDHPDNLPYHWTGSQGSAEKALVSAIYYQTGPHIGGSKTVRGKYPVRMCIHAKSNGMRKQRADLNWVAPRDMPLGGYDVFTINVIVEYTPEPHLIGISDVVLPSDFADKKAAFERKLEKAFRTIVNVPVAVAELRDFARVYQTILKNIASNAGKLSKAGDILLSYEFCLKQIIGDVGKLMSIRKQIHQRLKHLQQTDWNPGESMSFPVQDVQAVEGVTPWPYVYTPNIAGAYNYQTRRISRTETLKFSGRVSFDRNRYFKPYTGSMDMWARSLGFDNLLVAAWNLTPFSFLVDWVWSFPIDTFRSMGTWTDRPKVRDIATHMTVRDEYAQRLIIASGQGERVYNLVPEEAKAYRRWVGYPPGHSWASWPRIDIEWAATLAALFRSIKYGDTQETMRQIRYAEGEIAEFLSHAKVRKRFRELVRGILPALP